MSIDRLLHNLKPADRVNAVCDTEYAKITLSRLDDLVQQGKAVIAPDDYYQTASLIAATQEEETLVVAPDTLQIGVAASNRMIKHPRAGTFISYNSRNAILKALELFRGENTLETCVLSAQLLQDHEISPQMLGAGWIEATKEKALPRVPPIGISWSKQARPRRTTFMRIADAYSLLDTNKSSVTLGKKMYGGTTITCKAPSLSDAKRRPYEFVIRNLPITERDDGAKYSLWLSLDHNDSEPDANYRGRAFKALNTPIFFTRNALSGFIATGRRLREEPLYGKRRMHVNPFGKITPEGKNYTEALRTRCIFVAPEAIEYMKTPREERKDKPPLKPTMPTMTTNDALVGAYLINNSFSAYFFTPEMRRGV